MRNVFCQSLVAQASRPEFVFLTGDLGYKALEPLREALGKRFVNAGVAEQNMISVAAGLARNRCRSWVYSIAPFAYARPYEQIRNDICLHSLPVVIVGNGGGYGYGSMGATHHALEDYGALLCLPNVRVYIPAFDGDVAALVPELFTIDHPAYLRLGLSEEPKDMALPPYAPWRQLLHGGGSTLVVIGPLVGGILEAVCHLDDARRPNVWLVSELPLTKLPDAFCADVARTQSLIVVEEHVAQGGAGAMVAAHLMSAGCAPRRFTQRTAQGYVSGLYGSQKFHRAECGLDPASVAQLVASISSE